jgi:hypothetical protein
MARIREEVKMTMKVGKTYSAKHSRKGDFTFTVLKVDADGEFTHGTVISVERGCKLYEGEDLTVRTEFLTNIKEIT